MNVEIQGGIAMNGWLQFQERKKMSGVHDLIVDCNCCSGWRFANNEITPFR
jgi:hypothetical protein